MGSVSVHVANQMFGGIIVEPKEGFAPVDREFIVVQGEIFTKGVMGEAGFQAYDPVKTLNNRPTYYTFNGKPHGISGENALIAHVGETIRVFYGNMSNTNVSSFHIIGEILDRVYRGGSKSTSEQFMETVVVAAGQGIMVELFLEVPGTYFLVDHALSKTERGAWGALEVLGNYDPSIYSEFQEKQFER